MTSLPHELFEWPSLPSPCGPDALNACLLRAARIGASAVHLASDRPLKVTWRDRLYDAADRALADGEARALLEAALDAPARAAWARDGAAASVYAVGGGDGGRRFALDAVRIARDGGEGVYGVFRPQPGPPPPWAALALPDGLEAALGAVRDGLVMVAGTADGEVRVLDDPDARRRITEFPASPGATAAYRHDVGTSLHVEPLVEPGRLAEAVRRCSQRPAGLVVVREIPDCAAFQALLDTVRLGNTAVGALPARDVTDVFRRAVGRFSEGYPGATLEALGASLRLVVAGRTVPDPAGQPLPVWEWLAVGPELGAALQDLEPDRAAHAARGWVAAAGGSFRQAADALLRQAKISPAAHAAFLDACGGF